MEKNLKKFENLEVRISKREESSGNQQFYVRLVRTDSKAHGSILEYICFQTKHLERNECLERAWFSASMVARFVGLSSMDEIVLQDFNDEETEIIKKALYLRW